MRSEEGRDRVSTARPPTSRTRRLTRTTLVDAEILLLCHEVERMVHPASTPEAALERRMDVFGALVEGLEKVEQRRRRLALSACRREHKATAPRRKVLQFRPLKRTRAGGEGGAA